MKKRNSLFLGCLILLNLLILSGCFNADKYSAKFYYPRNPDFYEFGTAEGVITSEKRNFPSPASDPEYLLRLYLDGPISENLVSPFPEGTKLLDFRLSEQNLSIVLSSEFSVLEDMDLTIASACLTKTCFQITGAEQLVLICENNTLCYTRESFLFLDDSAVPPK